MKLTILQDTYLKLSTKQAFELTDAQRYFVKAGTEFNVLAHRAEGNHAVVTLDHEIQPFDRNTWYAFSKHIRIDGIEPNNAPHDLQPASISSVSVSLPGFNSRFELDNPIIRHGSFTWAEATANGERIPQSRDIVERIIVAAKAMQDIREKLSRPITVTSWYRPPAINAAVGGASNSRHLYGDAVDFIVDGVHPYDVYNQLDAWWGDKGGLASATYFTHVDCRGYMARWSYGF